MYKYSRTQDNFYIVSFLLMEDKLIFITNTSKLIIHLSDIKAVNRSTSMLNIHESNVFELKSSSGQVYVFRVINKANYDNWLDLIEKQINLCKENERIGEYGSKAEKVFKGIFDVQTKILNRCLKLKGIISIPVVKDLLFNFIDDDIVANLLNFIVSFKLLIHSMRFEEGWEIFKEIYDTLTCNTDYYTKTRNNSEEEVLSTDLPEIAEKIKGSGEIPLVIMTQEEEDNDDGFLEYKEEKEENGDGNDFIHLKTLDKQDFITSPLKKQQLNESQEPDSSLNITSYEINLDEEKVDDHDQLNTSRENLFNNSNIISIRKNTQSTFVSNQNYSNSISGKKQNKGIGSKFHQLFFEKQVIDEIAVRNKLLEICPYSVFERLNIVKSRIEGSLSTTQRTEGGTKINSVYLLQAYLTKDLFDEMLGNLLEHINKNFFQTFLKQTNYKAMLEHILVYLWEYAAKEKPTQIYYYIKDKERGKSLPKSEIAENLVNFYNNMTGSLKMSPLNLEKLKSSNRSKSPVKYFPTPKVEVKRKKSLRYADYIY